MDAGDKGNPGNEQGYSIGGKKQEKQGDGSSAFLQKADEPSPCFFTMSTIINIGLTICVVYDTMHFGGDVVG